MPDTSNTELVDGTLVEKHVSRKSTATEGRIVALVSIFVLNRPLAEVYPASLGYQCFQSLEADPHRVRKPGGSVIRAE